MVLKIMVLYLKCCSEPQFSRRLTSLPIGILILFIESEKKDMQNRRQFLQRLAIALLLCVAIRDVRGQGAAASALPADRAAAHSMVLWYRQPAKEWVEAMPIGNGRLGGMVFGNVAVEHIQLNEDTVWAGAKLDRDNPEALKNLPEVRRLLFAGKPIEAQALAEKTMMGNP